MERQRSSRIESGEQARSEPFPPGTTIARYRLVSLIGSGAMGDVYRAHDRTLDREVALKVLPTELVGDRDRVHRFAQEARSASALSHPHIVTIHEVGHARPVISVRAIGERTPRAGEVHYISMELVEGATLREALTSTLPQRTRLDLLAQVADGLAKAHGAGILHRDLKPDNILVSRDGYAKIVDFGLAKLIDTSWNPIGADSPTLRALTAHGELLGTPGYMAPEQITGKSLDGRADIFSFGCILYEAVTNTRAFEAETFVDTLYKILHENPEPLVNDPEMQRIIDRCLAKNRDERYASIREVAADLRAYNSQNAEPAPPRRRSDIVRYAAIATLIAALPILGFIFLRDDQKPATKPEQNVRRLTSDGRAVHATMSPDGRYVAYISSDPKGYTLWLKQIATGRAIAVVPTTMSHYMGLSFSRDGEYLYYTRYDAVPYAALYRVSILGGDAQEVLHDIDSRAAFTADGKRIAFVRDDYSKGTTKLIVANADGTNERELATLRLPDRLWWPSWSPKGDRIVAVQQPNILEVEYPSGRVRTVETSIRFDALRGLSWPENDRIVTAATNGDAGGHYRLWSIDPDDGDATPITNELIDLYLPTVSDDGALAALQVIRQANLYDVDTNGGIQQLTSGIGAANGLTGVSWAGDRIAYTSAADGKHDLWTMNQATREPTRVTDDAVFEARPLATRDGSTIVYFVSTSGQQTIWRANADGSNRKQLTSGPRDGDFALSPDSKSIAYTSLDTKANEWVLWTMPLAGGQKRRIAARQSVLMETQYTPDGRHIVFTGYEKDSLRLYRVAANGGPVAMLTDRRSRSASISPDGSTIACIYDTFEEYAAPLALLPITGGKPRMLDLKGTGYRWHPSGRAVSFVRRENGRADLWLQPLDGSAPKRLTHFNEGEIRDYAWSADGARAVVAHVIDSADVVVLR